MPVLTRLVLGLSIALLLVPGTNALSQCRKGEWPCAVIELDREGRVWVNGKAGVLNSELLGRCTKFPSDAAALIPDFEAPVIDVATVFEALDTSGVHVHFLTPVHRTELSKLFGMDPMEMCATESDRGHVELPQPGALAPQTERVKARDEEGGTVVLQVNSDTQFGAAELAARAESSFFDSDVLLEIRGETNTYLLPLSQRHWFIPPPPHAHHEVSRRSCFYPKEEIE